MPAERVPFQMSGWTKAMVDAHNAKLSKTLLSLETNGEEVVISLPVERKTEFTNLVIKPSTDEDRLNKLEKAWLARLRLLFPSECIGIQNLTLKLADDTRYTSDFWTIDATGQLTFWETKGFFRDDAKVKIKVAARQFRHFRFVLVEKKKDQWIETPIRP